MFALEKVCCLIILIGCSRAYEYNSNNSEEEIEGDDDSRPDYSKYYSVTPKEGAVNLGGFSANTFGFATPFEVAFGASNQDKQKLIPTISKPSIDPYGFNFPTSGASDFFEQSQSRRNEEKTKKLQKNRNEDEDEDDEDNLRPGPHYISHELRNEKRAKDEITTAKVPNHRYNYEEKDSTNYDEHLKVLNEANTPQLLYQYPKASGYATPYQKFSFQPIPAESKNQDDKKKCKKLKKSSGDEKIGELTCYVCEDQETNSKSTECSYQSDPKSTDLHRGNSERYSVPARKPQSFRHRRYADDERQEEEETDPYEYVKERSLSAQKEKNEDDEDGYGFEGYEESQPERSYSEIQSEEILKDPKKCTDVEKDGMSCRICKDPATGGNFESCSFSRQKKPEKYAYVSEKNYNSNDDPEEYESKNVQKNVTDEASTTTPSPRKSPRTHRRKASKRQPKGFKSEHPEQHEDYSDHVEKDEYYYPKSRKFNNYRHQKEENADESGEESKHSEQKEEDEEYDVSPYKKIGEYQFEHFPSEKKDDSKEQHYEASNRKEVEDVLADFHKKDRSQCKETKKNGMTCFVCVDENKVKNEDCMFVSESQPRGIRTKFSKEDVEKPSSNNTLSVEVMESAASSEIETVVKPPSNERKLRNNFDPELRASASARDSQRINDEDDREPHIETPAEFRTTDEGGAYSAETRPVYSKTLGMHLPKYMLEKSDFEKEFDAFATHL